MTRGAVWKLSVLTPRQAEDTVAAILSVRYNAPASAYTDLTKGQTTVNLYLETRPDWSKAARESLREALARIPGFRANAVRAAIRLGHLRPQDWAESWKRHFKALDISKKLLIRPSWSRRRLREGQVEVVLDPGLSFGTGQHPTTSFCLSELVRHRKPGSGQSFLDIGSGSGILAISAAKLGYRPVDAFDVDEEAVRVARANARLNKVAPMIRFRRKDLAVLPRPSRIQYDVICANLISDLLVAHRDRILARLQKSGVLVLAGVLGTEFNAVQAAYEAAGLRLEVSRTAKGWRSGRFCR